MRRLLRSFDVTNRRGFFDLPIEQVCGQIGGAADIGLSMPRRDRELLALLTRGDGRTALSALLKSWPDEQGEQPGDPALESQARVAHHINHNIDALQIDVSYKWRLTVRLTSALLAGTFAFGLTGSVGLQGTNRLALFVFVALVGGFFAWFVRDLVAVVEKARLQP